MIYFQCKQQNAGRGSGDSVLCIYSCYHSGGRRIHSFTS